MRKYGTLHKSEDEILQASFRFEGDSVAAKMHKLSKLKVLEKIWNPNINRQLGEEDIITEDSEDEMEEFKSTNYANWRSIEIVVVDVTIKMDLQINSLESAWEEKINKYQHLGKEIMDLIGGGKIFFYGFVIGARGK
ncbi:hypothetical protein chiPu_0010621 [Chiloscyllium punctatum]|uniref:Uncharacterized protein n=1 Tax=Chiloscyllium punctatum TaxID=137246 RepID=A0A401SP58_CHIPU|nr:hypothetical protein [Chiloscyllium punctatum]